MRTDFPYLEEKQFLPSWIPAEKSGSWRLNNFGRLILFFFNGWFGQINASQWGTVPAQAPFLLYCHWCSLTRGSSVCHPHWMDLPPPLPTSSRDAQRSGQCQAVGRLQKACDTWMYLWMSADNLSTRVSVFLLLEKNPTKEFFKRLGQKEERRNLLQNLASLTASLE